VGDSGNILTNVPVSIAFGGVTNYGLVVPTATTNVTVPQYTGNENGDWCLVQFVGGNFSSPIVTHIIPSVVNTVDAPLTQEGVFAYARVAGTQLLINKDGDFVLDSRDAGEEVTTDPNNGAITKKRAGGYQGAISVFSRNDIIVAGGLPRENEEESSLPGGRVAVKASRVLSLRSTLDTVTLNTQADADDGSAMQVNIQNERGSLRPAARLNDAVQITSGDDGDLFSYVDKLRNLLESIGDVLSTVSQDPGARAAGELITAFVQCHPSPTYQDGKITQGSAYCKIASVGTAEDIGGDETGIVNSQGEQIPEDVLVTSQITNYTAAVAETLASKITPNPVNLAKTKVTTALNMLAYVLQQVPFTMPYSTALKAVSPIITTLLESISSGGAANPASPIPLPASVTNFDPAMTLDDITGKFDPDTGALLSPGLVQQSDQYNLTLQYMEGIASGETQSNLESKYGVPNTPTGPVVEINPVTNVYWESPAPTIEPQLSLWNTALETAQDQASTANANLQTITAGFTSSWFSSVSNLVVPPAIQQSTKLATLGGTATTALAAATTPAGVLAAVQPLATELGGDSVIDSANAKINEELASL
jgi:hypothetical protein